MPRPPATHSGTPGGHMPSSAGLRLLARRLGGLSGVLLGRLCQVLAVRLPLLANGLRHVLSGLLAVLQRAPTDLAAAVEGLLPDLPGGVLDAIGHRTDTLVLQAAAGDEHARQEADGERADGQPEGVLLGDADGPASALGDLPGVGRRLVGTLYGPADRRADRVGLLPDGLL